jgi:hypothetical protein
MEELFHNNSEVEWGELHLQTSTLQYTYKFSKPAYPKYNTINIITLLNIITTEFHPIWRIHKFQRIKQHYYSTQ